MASVYVPNGGKDYPGKLRFLQELITFAETFRVAGTSDHAPLVATFD